MRMVRQRILLHTGKRNFLRGVQSKWNMSWIERLYTMLETYCKKKKEKRNHEPFSHHPNIELNQTSVYMLYSYIAATVHCATNVNL